MWFRVRPVITATVTWSLRAASAITARGIQTPRTSFAYSIGKGSCLVRSSSSGRHTYSGSGLVNFAPVFRQPLTPNHPLQPTGAAVRPRARRLPRRPRRLSGSFGPLVGSDAEGNSTRTGRNNLVRGRPGRGLPLLARLRGYPRPRFRHQPWAAALRGANARASLSYLRPANSSGSLAPDRGCWIARSLGTPPSARQSSIY